MRITRLPHRFPPLWPPLWPPASLRCTAIPPAYTRLEGKQKKLWRIPVLLWRGAWAPPLKKSISPPAAASRTTGPLRARLMPKRKKGKSILLQQSLNITPFFIPVSYTHLAVQKPGTSLRPRRCYFLFHKLITARAHMLHPARRQTDFRLGIAWDPDMVDIFSTLFFP